MIEFNQRSLEELEASGSAVNNDALQVAQEIFADVRENGETALRKFGVQFDGLGQTDAMLLERSELDKALDRIDGETRSLIERVSRRITTFAKAQRDSLNDLSIEVEGGLAGHRWIPLRSAGCYAPGGRYPLPSSVLMAAATARVAGVKHVWVASPNPNDVTLAAAAIADADGVLRLGGAQAIAALTFGIPTPLPACDVIVGPGNRYVTAAKALASHQTRIDMLAGPSELVVVAGDDARPEFVAADLLGQAEHDPDARPILIAFSETFAQSVSDELNRQIEGLSTAAIAIQSVRNGGFIVVTDINEAVSCCDQLAPEHLSLQGEEATQSADRFKGGSALFIGSETAEVFGDYGAGPNHVLPTGGTARSQSPLSVINFMRMQSRLKINAATASRLMDDATRMGRLEGLEAHARSCEVRKSLATT